MKKQQKQPIRHIKSLYRNFIQLILVGSVTGVGAGSIVTLFTILAHKGEELSRDAYSFVRSNPVFLPLLFLALLSGAFLISVGIYISSEIRGVGIPQAEGAARGAIRFRWWRDLVAMFSTVLLSIFMGLSIGTEGPSVFLGACAGDGVSCALKRNQMIRKYQITGGACTGLAVASNAPLTGVVFAFEEAHKRFTPEVFICAFSSVVFGMITRTLIYKLFGIANHNAFSSYVFNELPAKSYGFVVGAGVVCGIVGVLFYKTSFLFRRLLGKIKTKNPAKAHGIRVFIAVILGGAVSLLASGVMGGGHGLIESIGTGGGFSTPVVESAFTKSLTWALLTVLLAKFFITTVNVGAGIPCGIFVPIIAIGACLGGVLNQLWMKLGMSAGDADLMVMLCMAAFFSTVVKAPITSIIMICEFTGSFAPLLPVIIAVSLGFIIGEMSGTDGIYEELLELYEHESGIHAHEQREVFVVQIQDGALADRREVRDVLWPAGARVREITRGEEIILPDGDTLLHGGDVLTVVCRTDDAQKIRDELSHIVG